jgi:hypothetical protein
MDGMAELVPEALKLDRAAVRAHAKERFGFEKMVDEYERIYRELAGR